MVKMKTNIYKHGRKKGENDDERPSWIATVDYVLRFLQSRFFYYIGSYKLIFR